jgi:hypothetical protein
MIISLYIQTLSNTLRFNLHLNVYCWVVVNVLSKSESLLKSSDANIPWYEGMIALILRSKLEERILSAVHCSLLEIFALKEALYISVK